VVSLVTARNRISVAFIPTACCQETRRESCRGQDEEIIVFSVTRDVEIEWGQCDPAGIVYNPQFFSMFDWSAAVLFQKALGMGKREMLTAFDCAGFPLVQTSARFLVPCRYGEIVQITSTVLALRRSSFDLGHRLTKDGELCVECTQTRVWVGRSETDPSKYESRPIPPEVVARLTA
jgi:4-hydroxybenzoyl-CoA thioesterase